MNLNKFSKPIIIIAVITVGTYFLKGPSFPGNFEVTDISERIKTSTKQDFSGATLVNLDDDLQDEIFISGYGTSNLLLKHVEGTLLPLRIPELEDVEGLTFSASACDLDNDGRDEILMINRQNSLGTSHSRIVKYVAGKWEDILSPENKIIKDLALGYSATCIDRKGDGKYGLVVVSAQGPLMYLELSGGEIVNVAPEIGLNLTAQSRSIIGVPGPTGSTNIFVGNEKGPNFYFVNNLNGTFTERASALGLANPTSDARGASLIDSNHDDIADIVYGSHFGPTRILEQNREGYFKDVTPEKLRFSYAVNSTVVGDFNLDGYEDIYLNNIRGHNILFARHREDFFEYAVSEWSEDDLFGIATIAADLDGNGSFEILNTHGDGSHFPLTLYTVKPTGSWIKFSIKHPHGGTPRGALVRIRTNQRDQIRSISTGSGRFADYGHELLFGLLQDEAVLSVEVTLPSGKKNVLPKNFLPMTMHHLKIE